MIRISDGRYGTIQTASAVQRFRQLSERLAASTAGGSQARPWPIPAVSRTDRARRAVSRPRLRGPRWLARSRRRSDRCD